jgi:hypothetical protein
LSTGATPRTLQLHRRGDEFDCQFIHLGSWLCPSKLLLGAAEPPEFCGWFVYDLDRDTVAGYYGQPDQTAFLPGCTSYVAGNGRMNFGPGDLLRVVNLKTGEAAALSPDVGVNSVSGVAVSPNGLLIAYVDSKRSLKLCSMDGGDSRVAYEMQHGSIEHVSWAPDMKHLAAMGRDLFVVVPLEGDAAHSPRIHGTDVSWLGSGQLVYLSRGDLRLYDIQTKRFRLLAGGPHTPGGLSRGP